MYNKSLDELAVNCSATEEAHDLEEPFSIRLRSLSLGKLTAGMSPIEEASDFAGHSHSAQKEQNDTKRSETCKFYLCRNRQHTSKDHMWGRKLTGRKRLRGERSCSSLTRYYKR